MTDGSSSGTSIIRLTCTFLLRLGATHCTSSNRWAGKGGRWSLSVSSPPELVEVVEAELPLEEELDVSSLLTSTCAAGRARMDVPEGWLAPHLDRRWRWRRRQRRRRRRRWFRRGAGAGAYWQKILDAKLAADVLKPAPV